MFCLQLHAGAAHERYAVRRAGGGLLWRNIEHRFAAVRRQQPGQRRMGASRPVPQHSRPHSITITLPPLAVVAFRVVGRASVCASLRLLLANEHARKYDAIIIGGGHNGLVTAAYLARAGRKVLVLERRELVGGCAVTEEIWPGYRVSTGAYLTSLLQERIVRELELPRFGYRVDAKDPAFFSAFPDGRHFFMWQDRAQDPGGDRQVSAARCRSLSRITKTSWSGCRRSSKSLLLTTPPQFPPRGIGDFIEYLKLAGTAARPARRAKSSALVKIFTQSAAEFLDEWFESRAGKSHAGHRWRDRRQWRPALARHGLHPAAPLHGRRGRAPRAVGLRARRHGRGFRSHRRVARAATAPRSAPTRRSRECWCATAGRAAWCCESGEEIEAARGGLQPRSAR